jgi:hypothetical protein
MPRFRKSNPTTPEFFEGKHRFEHWYRDNTIYFITARCRDRFPAFRTEQAKLIFWDRFVHYTQLHGFVPWVTTLLDNHYHTLGYLKFGRDLGPMMRKLHGSVAKLVNDTLPTRHLSFWRERGHRDYFDGCIRDVLQCKRAYRYTLHQPTRHRVACDGGRYPHTRVNVDVESGIRRAIQLCAFLSDVPYARYERTRARHERLA